MATDNKSRLFEALLSTSLSLALRFLSIIFSIAESFAINVFRLVSSWFILPSSGVFEPKDSAVLIIGGEHKLDRHLALYLSELGYTVFALCTSQQDRLPSDQFLPSSSAPTANLVYEWHKRKEESPSTAWGMVAPIVADIHSSTDRYRAAETIQAFCTNNSLQLSAIIFLPSQSSNAPALPEKVPRQSKSTWDSSKAQASMWSDTAAHALKQPIMVVQDYVEMLAEAEGRIVLVSPSSLSGLSAYQETSPIVARYLRRQLEPFGIKTAFIIADILDFSVERSERNNLNAPLIWRLSTALAQLPFISPHFSTRIYEAFRGVVCQERIAQTVQSVISSRYPKDFYAIGVYSSIRGMHQSFLDFFFLFVKLLTHPTE